MPGRSLLVAVVFAVLCLPAAAQAQPARPAAPLEAFSVAGAVEEPDTGGRRPGARLAGIRAPEARTAVLGPVGDALGFTVDAACAVVCIGVKLAKGVAGKATELAGDVAASALDELAGGVASGGAWMMRKTARLIQRTTTPVLTSRWFGDRYQEMREVALLIGVLAFLCAITGAIVARDGATMLKTVGVRLPIAFGATGALAVVGQMGVEVADNITAGFAETFVTDTSSALRVGARSLLKINATGGPAVPAVITIVVALVGIAAAFTLWVELLIRDAGIYVVVFFAPLAFAAMIWERCQPILSRTLGTLGALIVAKPLMVALMSLGSRGVAAGVPEHGIETVLVVLVLMLLACLTPWALMALVPLLDGFHGSSTRRSVRQLAQTATSLPMQGGRAAMQTLMAEHFGGGGSSGPFPAGGSTTATGGRGSQASEGRAAQPGAAGAQAGAASAAAAGAGPAGVAAAAGASALRAIPSKLAEATNRASASPARPTEGNAHGHAQAPAHNSAQAANRPGGPPPAPGPPAPPADVSATSTTAPGGTPGAALRTPSPAPQQEASDPGKGSGAVSEEGRSEPAGAAPSLPPVEPSPSSNQPSELRAAAPPDGPRHASSQVGGSDPTDQPIGAPIEPVMEDRR